MDNDKEVYDGVLLNISSKDGYPADALSNFARHPFELDGIKCESMEGFLQSLKFKNREKQKIVCQMTGHEAKKASRGLPQLRWRITKRLWWNTVEYDRLSDDYQILLDRAFSALGRNEEFMKALKFTGDCLLCHSIGKANARKTVLTEYEFILRLEKLRGTSILELYEEAMKSEETYTDEESSCETDKIAEEFFSESDERKEDNADESEALRVDLFDDV